VQRSPFAGTEPPRWFVRTNQYRRTLGTVNSDMPRRRTADPLAQAVGARIRQLREEAGLTIEKLAYESELGSKGHLSTLERGLARPTIQTLKALADRLEVKLLDLVTFPEEDDRAKLIDRTREMSTVEIRRVLKLPHGLAKRKAGDRSAKQ
jgi:transcriptional regulator with XRE-family HTH domain